jgi:hypothetical protein
MHMAEIAVTYMYGSAELWSAWHLQQQPAATKDPALTFAVSRNAKKETSKTTPTHLKFSLRRKGALGST